jgi:hypothetical protein
MMGKFLIISVSFLLFFPQINDINSFTEIPQREIGNTTKICEIKLIKQLFSLLTLLAILANTLI